eukprot:5737873-Pyramimonas_sp.AAC.1
MSTWHIAIQHGAAHHSPRHGASRSIHSALHLPIAQSGVFEALPCLTFLCSFPVPWVDHVQNVLGMSRAKRVFCVIHGSSYGGQTSEDVS